jgi:hypothetical protein
MKKRQDEIFHKLHPPLTKGQLLQAFRKKTAQVPSAQETPTKNFDLCN